MPRHIIKLRDKYLEWSTIVDAPLTPGLTLEQLQEHIGNKYGLDRLKYLPSRLERVEKYGTSKLEGVSVADLIAGNRAGENETRLTEDEIYEQYCSD